MENSRNETSEDPEKQNIEIEGIKVEEKQDVPKRIKEQKQDKNNFFNNIFSKMREMFNSKIKRWTWQDWGAILITLAVFIMSINLASSFVHIPSPVFGGDYYRDAGFVRNIVEGNPFWSDGFYVNEIQYYPYAIFVIQAGIVKLTGMSVDSVFLYFPLLTILLGGLIWYQLGIRFFKDKSLALVNLAAFFALTFFYGLKSADFGLFVFVPLFLLLWLAYEQTNKKKFAITSGIVLGVTSWIHGGRFLTLFSTILVYLVLKLIWVLIKEKEDKIKLIKSYIKKYWVIFFLGAGLSLFFFLPLVIKYNFHSLNNVTLWGDTKLSLLGIGWIFLILKGMFFNFSNVPLTIASLISTAGIVFMLIKKKVFEQKWILLIFFANIIAMEHHLITKPLINYWFNPGKLVLIPYIIPFFFTQGTKMIYLFLKKQVPKRIFVLAIIILLLVPTFVLSFKGHEESQWIQYGKQVNPYVEKLENMATWITANVDKQETILSNDESGFMLAVLSGRKVMLTRRTHASYFVDIDERIADAMVAMESKDQKKSRNILDKYNVKFFYVDQNILKTPMRVRTDLEPYLKKNNITYMLIHDRYDIALPLESANTMDLLLISPPNISQEFMQLWEVKYQATLGNQVVGTLYQLK